MKNLWPNLLVLLIVILSVGVVELRLPVVQVLALLPLVIVPGAALATLLIDDRTAVSDSHSGFRSVLDTGGGFVRYPVSALMGILVLLFVALTMHALHIPIESSTIAIALGSGSLFVLLLMSSKSLVSTLPKTSWSASAKTVFAVGVLGIAVAGALALQPKIDERYVVLAFPATFVDQQGLTAHAGSAVNVPWVLRQFGHSTGGEQFDVYVDHVPTAILSSTSNESPLPSIAGAKTERTGTVSFQAPAEPGRYRLQLVLRYDPVAPPDTLGPVFLNAPLEVVP